MTVARISVSAQSVVGAIDRRLFGSFVEHLGRCVYDGIYEPSHPLADELGFRTDVLDLVRELGVTTIRYPGGNFVSGYRWEDGVGPRGERPTRLDLAWHSTETNEVGLHEFAAWNARVGSELMLAVNLGTRGVLDALDLVEYANHRSGTSLSDRRAANGSTEPFGVRMWCLGNEMDGPWQLGHRSADDYGKLASQTAMAMKQYDPALQLVVCGSSNSRMPTFGSWERTVLEHVYDDIDYISCHAYYEEYDGDAASFLASSTDMDRFIETVAATIDHVKAVTGSTRDIRISFDEWNVWYARRFETQERITDPAVWPRAPRLLEDVYNVKDAVVFGSLLISLLKHADRVKAASLAQLVNVIAPIMTEPGGHSWRQTTFYPFAITARLARGEVLRSEIEAGVVQSERHGSASAIDAVVSRDPDDGSLSVFVVHRGLHEAIPVDVALPPGPWSVVEAQLVADADLNAANTLPHPDRVTPGALSSTVDRDTLRFVLPPVSWAALRLRPVTR